MASRKNKKRLSSGEKKSSYSKQNKSDLVVQIESNKETELFDFSDLCEDYLDALFDTTRKACKKPFIQNITIQMDLGVAAVDVKDCSEIAYTPCFSSEVHILQRDNNTAYKQEGPQCSRKSKKAKSVVQTTEAFQEVELLGHPLDVTALSYTSENLLLSGSLDGTVKLWDSCYNLLDSYTDTMKCLSDIQASSKLDLFATCSLKGVLDKKGDFVYGASLFSFSRKTPLLFLGEHPSPTLCVRFHANGMYVATASGDGTVHMWNTREHGKPVRTFKDGGPDEWKRLEFSPDGKYLATTHWGSVNIWDLGSGKIFQTLGSADPVAQFSTDVCFGDSGKQLAIGSAAGYLKIWDFHSVQSSSIPNCEQYPSSRPLLRIRCPYGDIYSCISYSLDQV